MVGGMAAAPVPSGGDEPPPRPRTWADLDFTPRPAVRWFSPRVLADAALRVGVSAAFGTYLDKRELQAVVPAGALAHRAEAGELWFDYVADTGDGFDATYTLAWATAQPTLEVAGCPRPLPRGSLLVLGGDEVYPTAGTQAYRDRFTGPFRAALPWVAAAAPGDEEQVLALAGNHDWYDGLTSFTRLFCQGRWVGGRRTVQSRSYFAVRLPHRWWLWGIDIQLDADLDEPQIAYFRRVLDKDMADGDRLILCTGKPSWIDLEADPRAYDNLAFVERLVRDHRPSIRLLVTLTGDSHHYARYEAPEAGGSGLTHKITAGGGGAFLHPTHGLPRHVDVVTTPGRVPETYRLAERYPEPDDSRRRALGALALPWWNPSFTVVTAVAYSLLAWASQVGIRAIRADDGRPLDDAARGFGFVDLVVGLGRSSGAWLVVGAFLLALVVFAKPAARLEGTAAKVPAKVAMGAAHGALHLVASLAITLLAIRLVGGFADGGWFTLWLGVVVAVVGGVVGGVVLGLYLVLVNLAPGYSAHGNEAFSAQRIPDTKCFLRLHIAPDGSLEVFPVAVPRASRRWRLAPEAPDPGASWITPDDGGPRPELIAVAGHPGGLVVDGPAAPGPQAPGRSR